MALIRTNSGASAATETNLWTNASPAASQATGTITLNDNMSNYDMIKFTFRATTTNPATKELYALPSAMIDTTTPISIAVEFSDDGEFCRPIYNVNDTSFRIGTARRVYGTGEKNGGGILISVDGVKY